MNIKITKIILPFLLGFLGIGAIGGGGALMISPSGELIGMPLSILSKSSFNSFLIPGIILFTILGLAPCLLIFALIKKADSKLAEKLNFFYDMHWAWTYSIYVGFALVIWIQLETFYLQAVQWLHIAYTLLAIIIIFVALLPQVKDSYKIK